MPKLHLEIRADRVTTRDGTHPDDAAYLDQIFDQLKLRLIELQFTNPTIILRWEQ